MDDNEREALRQVRAESGPTDQKVSETTRSLGGALRATGLIVAAMVCLFLIYQAGSDPCFGYKVQLTIRGSDVERWGIWNAKCTKPETGCTCRVEKGNGNTCWTKNGSFEVRCSQVLGNYSGTF